MKNLQTPITDPEVIQLLVPHRAPMILVDTLIASYPNMGIVAFTIPEDNLFLEENEFSETGLMEHMAQAAALYAGFKNFKENEPAKEGFIATIKKLQIKSLPKTGALLKTEVHVLHEVAHISSVKLSTFNNDAEIATAEMSTVMKTD